MILLGKNNVVIIKGRAGGSAFMLEKVKDHIFDTVFPRFCVRCARNGSLLCETCSWVWHSTGQAKVEHVSNDVNLHVYSFAYADSVARDLICAWKYEYDVSSWEILQKKIAFDFSILSQVCAANQINAIVPLPLHKYRYNERGFDQAEEIAKYISKELKIPCQTLLRRTRKTGKQAERSEEKRKTAMEESPFSCSMNAPGSVLLVDDVWTTGSTALAAARTLREAGSNRIVVYTLAKG